MSKKIASVMSHLFEDSEYTSPLKAMQKDGHDVVVVGPKQGQELKSKQGEAEVTVDIAIGDASPEDYDALLIPGGFSPDIIRTDERFVEFAKHFVLYDKPILTICHGPQLLITADVLHGRNLTGFKSIIQDLRNAGANFFDEEVVVCGNLVTSRTPDDLNAFNRESLKKLK
ncbi:type 1 glutamine amidotransferase domain-containing protein [Salisediminibacterium halotolerans]|uniref:Protease I n=1 Tax=Salisediminibacterium halotolerans TaxID=517425 RepID=A0A1H9WBA4_9BACI|nr:MULTISPECIES: type 1 glutamine amidotransferase domain-containing protein [Salisediminibacterium]RLJ74405.1 protease I [Actinophytocola xinjiangensis]RPE87502.1 protease I [Salisediminibacterium halotolerans]TWG35242.1 protease I [Salisediminibacterium halotolerans]SES31188.1 protease I [Salisediminibacterium haloalkalitolerans]GEL06722.1 general stress protein 18 [Salisediminibacterium halotolerans]